MEKSTPGHAMCAGHDRSHQQAESMINIFCNVVSQCVDFSVHFFYKILGADKSDKMLIVRCLFILKEA